jgi:hypothetical protein
MNATVLLTGATGYIGGLLGRAYWYALLPVHSLMFRGMLQQIARMASREPPRAEPVHTT